MSVLSNKLAVKYFKKRVISWLAVLTVAVSVFITLVVMTVMNGLAEEFKEKNHRLFGDCIISSSSLVGFAHYERLMTELAGQDFVEVMSPVILSSGLISLEGGSRGEGVDITGIDPESFCKVTEFADTLYEGSISSPADIFVNPEGGNEPGCVRGISMMARRGSNGQYPSKLAYSLKIDVSCFPLTAGGTLAKGGTDLANTKSFVVANDSNAGLPRIDESMLYVPFNEAQLLCGMGGAEPRISAVFIKFKPDTNLNRNVAAVRDIFDSFKASMKGEAYADLLEKVTVQSWKQYRREDIAPIEKEGIMLMAMFVLIGVVTVFVILVVFYLIISHKSRDIGLFKSVGVSTFSVMGVFLRFAAIVGITGASVGTLSGCLFLLCINDIENWLYVNYGWQLWDRSMYSIGEIPNDIQFPVAASIAVLAVIASLAGAVIPVMMASLRRPVDTLRVTQV